jgi:hypothetical protein
MITKNWWQSRTIWLLVAQLLGVWAAYVTGEASMIASLGITMTTISGVIVRFYTEQPIQRSNGTGRDLPIQ